jgi:hypothetical protein
VSKRQSVHGAGDVNVSEYRSDVAAILKDLDGLVGVSGLNGLKTFVLSNLDGAQANERFIVDDKDQWPFLPAFRHTLYSRVFCRIPVFTLASTSNVTTMCRVDSFRGLGGEGRPITTVLLDDLPPYLFCDSLLVPEAHTAIQVPITQKTRSAPPARQVERSNGQFAAYRGAAVLPKGREVLDVERTGDYAHPIRSLTLSERSAFGKEPINCGRRRITGRKGGRVLASR